MTNDHMMYKGWILFCYEFSYRDYVIGGCFVTLSERWCQLDKAGRKEKQVGRKQRLHILSSLS